MKAIFLFALVAATLAHETEVNLNFDPPRNPFKTSPSHESPAAPCINDGDVPSADELDCSFVDTDMLKRVLSTVVCGSPHHCTGAPAGASVNGGFGNNVWASVVNRAGRVCAIVHSGLSATDQWLGSRQLSAALANTAHGFSLDNFAISTGALYGQVQPGGAFFGLENSNPSDAWAVNAGNTEDWGKNCWGPNPDPLCGKKVGGTVAFGGGVPLYTADGLVGGLGIAGETSCSNHIVAWKVRDLLGLDWVENGPNFNTDNLVYTTTGWWHPLCSLAAKQISDRLDLDYPYSRLIAKRGME